mmetsp:Transcript_138979/g.241678  ORF Transcript_138979/g.241678 Transcript_138979/m.241678 type:complete len:215 (+) Transcript_138979:3129-3773(+)
MSIRDVEERHHIRINRITNEEASALELDDVPLLDSLQCFFTNSTQSVLGDLSHNTIQIGLLVNHPFRDEMIKLIQLDCNVGLSVGQPGQLLLRLLYIASQIQRHGNFGGLAGRILLNCLDESISPIQQRNFFTLGQKQHILFFEEHLRAKLNGFLPHAGILLVELPLLLSDLVETLHNSRNTKLIDTSVPRCNGIQDLFVDIPNLLPFHGVNHL